MSIALPPPPIVCKWNFAAGMVRSCLCNRAICQSASNTSSWDSISRIILRNNENDHRYRLECRRMARQPAWNRCSEMDGGARRSLGDLCQMQLALGFQHSSALQTACAPFSRPNAGSITSSSDSDPWKGLVLEAGTTFMYLSRSRSAGNRKPVSRWMAIDMRKAI